MELHTVNLLTFFSIKGAGLVNLDELVRTHGTVSPGRIRPPCAAATALKPTSSATVPVPSRARAPTAAQVRPTLTAARALGPRGQTPRAPSVPTSSAATKGNA